MKALLIVISILYFLVLTVLLARFAEKFRSLVRTKGKSIRK